MSNAFSFLRRLDYKKEREYWDELKDINVELKNEYIIEEYLGKALTLHFQLVLKKGLFSNEVVIGSDNKIDVETVRDYIGYFPQFKKLSIVELPLAITSGNFAIKHVSKMTGTEGKQKDIERIVHEWNGGQEAIDYIMNGVEEALLGYFPSTDHALAKAYVDLINAGANREATPEEIAKISRDIIEFTNSLKAK